MNSSSSSGGHGTPVKRVREEDAGGLLSGPTVLAAFRNALTQLTPRAQYQNAATFGLYLASIFMTLAGMVMLLGGTRPAAFALLTAAWLWLSVLLANFADALAVEWARARAATLGSTGVDHPAKRLRGTGRSDYQVVEAGTLRRGHVVLVETNDIIPADGTVIEGMASVSEAAVTGESAPVLRSTSPSLSSVRAGTLVLSDWLVVRVRCREGSFFDPIATSSELTAHPHTALEIGLSVLLVAATLAFLLSVAFLSDASMGGSGDVLMHSALVALLVCCLPIATRASVFAAGLISLARLRRAHVLATAGASLEAAASIDLLVLDKTGTITRGERRAVAFRAIPGIAEAELLEVAQLASLADDTPEGRSVVDLVLHMTDEPPRDLSHTTPLFHEFSANTRISGVDVEGRRLRKGAVDAVQRFLVQVGSAWPPAANELVEAVARAGSTPLVVADGPRVLGVIELHDVIKVDMREYCAKLRGMGIRTVMVTGDNPLTAATIAAEAGVDNFLAEATPEGKSEFIRRSQREGHRVAMYGDGTNDAPALAQADFAVVMNSGTQEAKDAGDLVDLDSSPTKFITIVEIGKQILMTRCALSAFSIAADLAKYCAIIPVILASTYPGLHTLNLLRLSSAPSAILAAVIFSILIIAPLLALAIRAIKTPTQSRSHFSHFSQGVYVFGGILSVWTGIKLMDALLTAFRLV